MMSYGLRLACCLLLIAVQGGCTDGGGAPYLYADSGPTELGRADLGAGFLTPCARDEDCTSRLCRGALGQRRCARPCTEFADCPPLEGWSCSEQACSCVPTGFDATRCGVDGDCDGIGDKVPAAEVCNDEDDDCNGVVDDVPPGSPGASLYYPDEDGDGHGDGGKSTWLCKVRPPFVTLGDDCNDKRRDINPDAIEVCGDDEDNDCDLRMDDPDVCGYVPIPVDDVAGEASSARIGVCERGGVSPAGLDLTEIVAKQDKNAIRFTLRVAGAPLISAACGSYTFAFGDETIQQAVVYVVRPSGTCGGVPALEAFVAGEAFASSAVYSFNAASPGHVSLTVPKSEILVASRLPVPSYRLQACTNGPDSSIDPAVDCEADRCLIVVHR